jgi:alcohol dehydrogenase YqhD (iron-dependent ADH family)
MNDFVYENKTKVFFGKDKELLVGETLKKHGAKKVFICFGQGSVIKSGLLKKVEDTLTAAGLGFFEYGGICANPSKTHAVNGITEIKKHGCDFVLAIGGGSVIDEAKFIAAGALNGDVWDYYDGSADRELPSALGVAAVLTLPAAGSEGSTASVIRDEKTGVKYSIEADAIRPAFTFINPELCFTLPKSQIAYGASDILAHLMERYFSPEHNVAFTDGLLGGAMTAIMKAAGNVYGDNRNYGYWSEFCLMGLVAHNGMLDLGRSAQDWATHNIENTLLSGVYNIAHGAGLAVIFPAWLKFVANKNPEKILQFASGVMGAEGRGDTEVISGAINKLEDFYKSLNLSVTLSGLKIDADEVKKLAAELYPDTAVLGSYGRLGKSDIIEIIELAR